MDHNILFNILVYLSAAIIAVPLAKRLGLGPVLGYLVAGIIIGPWVLGLIKNVNVILHFSEFGVVLLLFLIGLELNPRRLWSMRKPILGMGGLQVVSSGLLLVVILILAGLQWNAALVTAMALALSSTAIALQTLTDKNWLSTPAGTAGFSVLLFQDIAVIPMLAIIPLLAIGQSGAAADPMLSALKGVGAVVLVILGGQYLVRPLFHIIARTGARELFTAFSLFLVLVIAYLMQLADLSMALGSFLAGVLLAESEYRHQLENDLEPFKGLLLGLFFISVGMSIDFSVILANPLLVMSLVLALVVLKMVILIVLGKIFDLDWSQNILFAFLLCQGGEFAFVLMGIASSFQIVPDIYSSLVVVVVAISMLTTPLLIILFESVIEPRLATFDNQYKHEIIDEINPVIVIGFGRFGQIIARLLHANRIPTTIIDHNPEHIERARMFGYKVFYGEATRIGLLNSAGAGQAKAIVLAMDDKDAILDTVRIIQKYFPQVQILSRAWDMLHAYKLLDLGIEDFQRETFLDALKLGEKTLVRLGKTEAVASLAAEKFRIHDLHTLHELYAVHEDEEKYITLTHEVRQELEQLFEADEKQIDEGDNTGGNV